MHDVTFMPFPAGGFGATSIDWAEGARQRINATGTLRCYGGALGSRSGIAVVDPTKLVVDVGALGITGFAARAWLKQHCRINPEFADLRRMVCSVTIGDDQRSVDMLVTGKVIDSAVLQVIAALSEAGCNIVGPADASGRTLRVLSR